MNEFAGDGWVLLSAQAQNEETPDTFPIPPLGVRTSLIRGDLVKLLFDIATSEEDVLVWGVERMWVRVLRVTTSGYVGKLENEPFYGDPDGLTHGDFVEFGPEHIADLIPYAWPKLRAAFARRRPDLDIFRCRTRTLWPNANC